ncbi:MAG: amidohydrolase [Bacteroidota bacterium]
MHLFRCFFLFLGIFQLWSCESSDPISLIITNGNIATVAPQPIPAEAIAISEGRIVALGTNEEMLARKGPETKLIDARGKFVMPGFIEGHGHFSMLGESMINLNFLNTDSWEEILAMVAEKVQDLPPGVWIEGRGWHQEKWDSLPNRQWEGYPFHDELSALTPDNPVLLKHASGHSSFANARAMQAAGISSETPDPTGGAIVRDNTGRPIGVFEERAQDAIYRALRDYEAQKDPAALHQDWLRAIELAQQECLQKGITTFQDAGSKFYEIENYQHLAEQAQLRLRLWVMVRHSYEEMKDQLDRFPILDVGNHFFSCRAIKTEVDGALGSFGAWLLRPYADKVHFVGQNTTEISEVERIAGLAQARNMQLCIHAIGDRANREVLDIIQTKVDQKTIPEDHRWRIEHAQHLHPRDIPRFNELGVIASMQGVHCTSDAPFVVDRLGVERAAKGAYAWRSLLDSGAQIANGTDAPVEDVDPLRSFYASVTRKRADNGLEFFTEQKMTRAEALHSYTLGNAYAGFEEALKGSLEVGKLADIVILSNDLLTCTDEEILTAKVLYTIVGGRIEYQAEE